MRGSKSVALLLLLLQFFRVTASNENYLVPYKEVAETYVEYPNTPIVQSLLEAEQEILAVSMSVWSTPIDFRHPVFYFIKGIVRRLDKDLLEFQPNYLLADGHERGCRTINPTTGTESGNMNDTFCVENCSNHGRYCATNLPQDPLLKTKINGFAIVEESLRRHCIW
jgi:hypothetical protein